MDAVTKPDSEGVRGLTIEEVARIVEGRIKTAFHDVRLPEEEMKRRSSWVVNGIDKWGEQVGS